MTKRTQPDNPAAPKHVLRAGRLVEAVIQDKDPEGLLAHLEKKDYVVPEWFPGQLKALAKEVRPTRDAIESLVKEHEGVTPKGGGFFSREQMDILIAAKYILSQIIAADTHRLTIEPKKPVRFLKGH